MRAALYLRVSTKDQDIARQEHELREAAARKGYEVVQCYPEKGVSGVKGRDKRPQFDALCKAATRREFDVVMAWSVDRLGRSLQHLIAFLSDIHALNIDLYLHQQGIDTTTPSGKMMFQMIGAFAEFERCIIIERINSGIAMARIKGTKSGAPIGRAPVTTKYTRAQIRTAYKAGNVSMRKLAQKFGVSLGTVQGCVA